MNTTTKSINLLRSTGRHTARKMEQRVLQFTERRITTVDPTGRPANSVGCFNLIGQEAHHVSV